MDNDSYFDDINFSETIYEPVPDLESDFERRSLEMDQFLNEVDNVLGNHELSKKYDIYCPRCLKGISYAGWSRHCNTKIHNLN